MYPYMAADPWRDNRRFVRIACAIWVCGAAIGGAVSVASASRALDRYRNGEPVGSGLGLAKGSGWLSLLGLSSIGGLVMIIIATFRLAKSHQALGRPSTRWGPGWAIAGRLIPLASLVIPALQLNELWKGSDPTAGRNDQTWRTKPGSAAARAVLAINVIAAVIAIVVIARVFRVFLDAFNHLGQSGVVNQKLAQASHDTVPWRVGGLVMTVIGAALASWLIIKIADRQQHLHETQPMSAYLAPQPSHWQSTFPAGWYADPSGRYPLRWWDGTQFTGHVSANGATAYDPPDEAGPD